MDKNNQASLAVAVVCLPDRGGDALVAYRLDDQANGRRWVDADVEVLVDHRHATPRPGRGGRPSGQVASDGPFDLPDPGALIVMDLIPEKPGATSAPGRGPVDFIPSG
jgi:hypothetical protein